MKHSLKKGNKINKLLAKQSHMEREGSHPYQERDGGFPRSYSHLKAITRVLWTGLGLQAHYLRSNGPIPQNPQIPKPQPT